MTTQEIANRLVELCRKGEYETCYKELYSPKVVSIEPEHAPGPSTVHGLDGIAEKGKKWNEMMEEFHGSSVGDPHCVWQTFFLHHDDGSDLQRYGPGENGGDLRLYRGGWKNCFGAVFLLKKAMNDNGWATSIARPFFHQTIQVLETWIVLIPQPLSNKSCFFGSIYSPKEI